MKFWELANGEVLNEVKVQLYYLKYIFKQPGFIDFIIPLPDFVNRLI